jgi:hypothetical protein
MGVSLERVILVNSIFQKNVTGTPEILPVYAVFSPVRPAGTPAFQQPLVLPASSNNYILCFYSFHRPFFFPAHFSCWHAWSAKAQLSLLRSHPLHANSRSSSSATPRSHPEDTRQGPLFGLRWCLQEMSEGPHLHLHPAPIRGATPPFNLRYNFPFLRSHHAHARRRLEHRLRIHPI